jgi:hypothetical protein
MKQPHYECIVAWAEGKTIQFESVHGNWFDVPHPIWDRWVNYRVKPESRPDFSTYLTVSYKFTGNQTPLRYASDNVKFTYDGDTWQLKSAEVLK